MNGIVYMRRFASKVIVLVKILNGHQHAGIVEGLDVALFRFAGGTIKGIGLDDHLGPGLLIIAFFVYMNGGVNILRLAAKCSSQEQEKHINFYHIGIYRRRQYTNQKLIVEFRNFPEIDTMKVFVACLSLISITIASSFMLPQNSITGAWTLQSGANTRTLVILDGYLSETLFDIAGKKFHETKGGVARIDGNKLSVQYEFHSGQKDVIGTTVEYTFNIANGNLVLDKGGVRETWKRVDDNKNALAGVWYISGRMQNGQIVSRPLAARRTIKIMSGSRFQWVQVNAEAKETGATGGGTYSFENGKYTENIEFFSRDSSRVGASLSFEGTVNGKVWTHKGLSSRGEPIHEEWTKIN